MVRKAKVIKSACWQYSVSKMEKSAFDLKELARKAIAYAKENPSQVGMLLGGGLGAVGGAFTPNSGASAAERLMTALAGAGLGAGAGYMATRPEVRQWVNQKFPALKGTLRSWKNSLMSQARTGQQKPITPQQTEIQNAASGTASDEAVAAMKEHIRRAAESTSDALSGMIRRQRPVRVLPYL